jgi:hypothetical protein
MDRPDLTRNQRRRLRKLADPIDLISELLRTHRAEGVR